MTKDELLAKLHELAKDDDTEMAHIWADDALLQYIDDADITKAWHEIRKWFA